MTNGRKFSIRIAYEHPELRDTILPHVKQGKNLPPSVERYVEEGKDQGMDEGKAWAIAWSRYCQFKNPNSPHCKQDSYFEGRSASLRAKVIRLAHERPELRAALLPLVKTAVKRGETVYLARPIKDLSGGMVPKGTYKVFNTDAGEVSLQPQPPKGLLGYLVSAAALAAAR